LSAPASTATLEAPAILIPSTSTPALQSLVTAVITSSPTVAPTATLPPTIAMTATSLPAPTQAAVAPASVNQTVSLPALPLNALLTGITPVKQGWNNCGPANITMALSYYGWTKDQDYAISYLKPDREDKNVNP